MVATYSSLKICQTSNLNRDRLQQQKIWALWVCKIFFFIVAMFINAWLFTRGRGRQYEKPVCLCLCTWTVVGREISWKYSGALENTIFLTRHLLTHLLLLEPAAGPCTSWTPRASETESICIEPWGAMCWTGRVFTEVPEKWKPLSLAYGMKVCCVLWQPRSTWVPLTTAPQPPSLSCFGSLRRKRLLEAPSNFQLQPWCSDSKRRPGELADGEALDLMMDFGCPNKKVRHQETCEKRGLE